MKNDWPTRSQDISIARQVINQFGGQEKTLGIFELVKDPESQATTVHLAEWVIVLTQYFRKAYGNQQGDFVMKKVVSNCLINGETVH